MAANVTHERANYTVLAGQVDLLDKKFDKLEDQFATLDATLSQKIDRQGEAILARLDRQQALVEDRSRPNYLGWATASGGLFVALVTLLSIIGSLAKVPIDQTIERHNQELQAAATKAELQRALDGISSRFAKSEMLDSERLTIREHEEFKRRIDDRIAWMETSLMREVGRMDREVAASSVRDEKAHDAIVADLVRRPEITSMLGDIKDRLSAVSRNLEDARRDFGANFTVGDQLKQMQTEIISLEGKLFSMGLGTPTSINGGAKP